MDDVTVSVGPLTVSGDLHSETWICLDGGHIVIDHDGGVETVIRAFTELAAIPEARAVLEKYKIYVSKD